MLLSEFKHGWYLQLGRLLITKVRTFIRLKKLYKFSDLAEILRPVRYWCAIWTSLSQRKVGIGYKGSSTSTPLHISYGGGGGAPKIRMLTVWSIVEDSIKNWNVWQWVSILMWWLVGVQNFRRLLRGRTTHSKWSFKVMSVYPSVAINYFQRRAARFILTQL